VALAAFTRGIWVRRREGEGRGRKRKRWEAEIILDAAMDQRPTSATEQTQK